MTLGSLSPDSTGTVTGTFTLPATLEPGSHTLVLSGTGADGLPRTVTAAFTVTAATPANPGGSALPAATGSGGSSPLAVTGAQLLSLIALSAGAIGGGWLLVVAARRRRTHRGS